MSTANLQTSDRIELLRSVSTHQPVGIMERSDSPQIDMTNLRITEEPLDVTVESTHTSEPLMFDYTPTIDDRADVKDVSGLEGPPEDAKRKIIKAVLHQVTVQNKPLYRCQMPIFCTDPVSMLQKLTDYFQYAHILHPLSTEMDPEKRMLGIAAFYVSIWHLQVPLAARVRSPFNPVLGEFYRTHFGSDENRVNVLAEQITHHPPSSAFVAWNKHHQWSFEAYVKPDSSFSGTSVLTTLVGDLVAHLYAHNNERYVCTYPKYNVKGLILGPMRMELTGKPTISCEQTGLVCELEFKQASPLSNDLATGISGRIFNVADKKKTLYTINGHWHTVVKYNGADKVDKVLVDIEHLREDEKFLPSPKEMAPNETNAIWGQVKKAILTKDEALAMSTKSAIEEDQRVITADRKKQNVSWAPKYFEIMDETWRCPQIRDVFNLPKLAPHSSALDAGLQPEEDKKKKGWFKKAFGGQ